MISRTGLLLIAGLLAFVAGTGQAVAQIVALGASNVAGRGVGEAFAWPAQLEDLLAAKGRHVHIANAGISGDTNAGMLKRLDSAVPAGTKIVLLDLRGGNWNAGRLGQGNQTAELESIKAKLRSRHITIIPMWRGPELRGMRQRDHIHFTAEGHKLIAAHMVAPVLRALR